MTMLFSLLVFGGIVGSQSLHFEQATDSIANRKLGAFQDLQQPDKRSRKENLTEKDCSSLNIWFVPETDGKCHCGPDYRGVVDCHPNRQLAVLDCNCLTQHVTPSGLVVSVVANCIFNCLNMTEYNTDDVYKGAPSNCGQFNRQGTLCGDCKTGHTLPPYSYSMKCMKCNAELLSWGYYVARAFGPLTLFIGIILVFRIEVLSPKIQMFVIAAQIISSPVATRILETSILMEHQTINIKAPLIFMENVYGIWNLDFLRFGMTPEFCINVSPLPLLALDYLIAVYPMFLMAAAYVVVQLHHCGCNPLFYAWKPFHPVFARFRRQWGIKTTIVDAFASFFFLSTNKLFCVSFSLLVGTRMRILQGEVLWVLFYVPSIELFGEDHLPYFLLALGVLTVFLALPTSLLLFFQCRVFQKFLRKLHIRGSIIDEFVSTFHQYYKDGSNGERDTRWFSGFFVILQTGAYLTYANSQAEICYILHTILFIVLAMMVLLIQPYRAEYETYNTLITIFLLWLALSFAVSAKESLTSILDHNLGDGYVAYYVVNLIPLVYIVAVVLHHLYKKWSCFEKVLPRRGAAGTPQLPHRLLHSSMYLDSSFK